MRTGWTSLCALCVPRTRTRTVQCTISRQAPDSLSALTELGNLSLGITMVTTLIHIPSYRENLTSQRSSPSLDMREEKLSSVKKYIFAELNFNQL